MLKVFITQIKSLYFDTKKEDINYLLLYLEHFSSLYDCIVFHKVCVCLSVKLF